MPNWPAARASLKKEEFFLQADGANLKGYIVYDLGFGEGKRPLVINCPSVCGMTPFDYEVADRLAAAGYVGMVLDTYGEGWFTEDMGKDRDAARQRMMPMLNDRAAFRRRLLPFLQYGRAHPMVDAGRTAALGYCYGGTALLELVRAGTGITGVCGFHSYAIAAKPLGPVQKGNTSKVLLLHGNDDAVVPAEEVLEFMKEFTEAKVDFQVNFYGNASHGFAHPTNGGPSYDPKWDRRSWRDMMSFFEEIFTCTTTTPTALGSAIAPSTSSGVSLAPSSASSSQFNFTLQQDAYAEAVAEKKWACCPPPGSKL
eukprot:gnl/MRDRNA2_/MRDRNA2_121609_c0_seq1.p1 gnl/MRDRNA2_/MRDRNA2_121609_c0~~gnl/MRDRNA2_/MRDRNA2_121609_c0_seq1.p1  ORF type:complete len:312 (+),score=56.20 gnl/MRDRNA2_/MRDRNA2_121609_c0_seq1:97-1032(+)